MSALTIPSGCSKIQLLWLEDIMRTEDIAIQHALSPGGEYYIKGVGYVDGYCLSTNTVYEFHGSYWHGDPHCFKSEDTNEIVKKTYGELYRRTVKRDASIKALGYNLTVTWESEINRRNLDLRYPKLIEKYGKKPIRIASQPRIIAPIADELRIGEALSESIKSLKFKEVEVSKKLMLLREELDRLETERNDLVSERQEMESKLVLLMKPVDTNKLFTATYPLNLTGILKIEYDQCGKFLEDCYIVLPRDALDNKDFAIKAADIRETYIKWCNSQRGCVPIGKTSFYKVLDMILGSRLRHSIHKYIGIKPKVTSTAIKS